MGTEAMETSSVPPVIEGDVQPEAVLDEHQVFESHVAKMRASHDALGIELPTREEVQRKMEEEAPAHQRYYDAVRAEEAAAE